MRLTFTTITTVLLGSMGLTVLATPVSSPDANPEPIPVPVANPIGGGTSTIILGEEGEEVSSAHLAARGIEPRSFHNTCQNCISMINYSQWHVLRCSCRKSNGSYQDTSLNLDGCLMNNNGYLQWKRNGFFSAHCTSPQYSTGAGGTIILWITCLNNAQQYVGTGFTISERIHNYNGVLGCDVPN